MQKLENSRLFPIIAWTTVILFVGFTVHLSFTLRNIGETWQSPKTIEEKIELQHATLYDAS